MKDLDILPARTGTLDVALVSLPWAPATEPLLGLSILKAALAEDGYASRVFHTPPSLLRWCTIETYSFLSEMWGVNEFLFSGIISGVTDQRQLEVLSDRCEAYANATSNPKYPTGDDVLNLVLHVREKIIPAFMDEVVEDVMGHMPRLIGLTCMFDQTIASIALAKLLKERDPTITIVLGGYALFGDPGKTVSAAFPWIDQVVVGDGERAIVQIAEQVINRERTNELSRGDLNKPIHVSPNVVMEEVPHPDYSDWFDEIADLNEHHKIKIGTKALSVESSRGCWWGEKHHCIFCGIDEETLKYRKKSPERTLDMLDHVRTTYGDHIFRFSDYIMPNSYHQTVLPALERKKDKYRLHTEIKANLTRDQIAQLVRAGFCEVQPGIESFLTPVLKRMDKGVSGIANIALLKYGYLERLVINYNILYGLPDDDPDLYRGLLKNIPALYHLMPPVSCSDTAITRFAPLQESPEKFGISRERTVHHMCYEVIFPRAFLESSGFDLDMFSYYFEWGFDYKGDLSTLYQQLCHQVDHWKQIHRTGFAELSFKDVDGRIGFTDTRFGARQAFTLSETASDIYRLCDGQPTHLEKIASELDRTAQNDFGKGLDELLDRRVIWHEDELVIGLGVPRTVSRSHKNTNWNRKWVSPFI